MRKFFGILFVSLGVGILWAEETTVFIGLRKEVSVEKTATNITVISEDEIKTSDAKNVSELLGNIVGITDASKYGTLGSQSDLRIRSGGGSASQVLVMVDGRSVNNSSLGSANLAEIPAENIERIEIMRGPSSALYGANALGGVVNIITKKAVAAKPKTDIGINYGTFNTRNYNFNFTAMPGKANIFLSGAKNLTDGFRDNSKYDATNFSTKIGYDLEKYGECTLSNGFLTSDLGVSGTNNTSISDWDNSKEKATSSPKANQKDKKFYSQLEHRISVAKADIKTNLYYDTQKRTYKDPDTHPEIWDFDANDDRYVSQTVGGGIQVNTLYDIIAGVDGKSDLYRAKNEITKTTDIDKWSDTSAIFVQKIFSFEPLTTIIGARYDYNNVFGGQLNPRVVNTYKLNDNFRFSSTIGRAFRAPTFNDLYWADPFMPGNPNLKPEASVGADFGIEHKLKDILVSKITLFYTDVNDFIQWADDGTGKWTPLNVGKVFSRGVELELNKTIIKNLTETLNYTFLESMGKNEGGTYKTLQYTPKHRLNYTLNYSAPLEIKAKASVGYTHKQEWSDYLKHKIPGYTLVNLRLSRKILQSEVYFSVENIFDKRYVARENYPLPGRTFSGGINVYLWD